MKGYKILLTDMKSPVAGMEYEVGREYEMEDFDPYSNNHELLGFHFYRSLFLGICHLFPIANNDAKYNFKISDFKIYEIESPDDCCLEIFNKYIKSYKWKELEQFRITLGLEETSPYNIIYQSFKSVIATKKIKLIREMNIDEIRDIIAKELLINLGFLPFSQFDSEFSRTDLFSNLYKIYFWIMHRRDINTNYFFECLDTFMKNKRLFEKRYGSIMITKQDIYEYRYLWWVRSPRDIYPYPKNSYNSIEIIKKMKGDSKQER